MTVVTARFKVARKTPWGMHYDHEKGEWVGTPQGWEVELTPDYAQGRNADWAAATPSGMIRLTIKNELAANFFDPGKAVHITFEENDEE